MRRRLYYGANDQSLRDGLGLVAETLPIGHGQNSIAQTSGRMHAIAVGLRAGQRVTGLRVFAFAAAIGPALIRFALYDAALALRASSANDTTLFGAAGAYTAKNFPAAYDVPVTGLYYAAILQVADTCGALMGFSLNDRDETGPLPNGTWAAFEQDDLADLPDPAVPSFGAAGISHILLV